MTEAVTVGRGVSAHDRLLLLRGGAVRTSSHIFYRASLWLYTRLSGPIRPYIIILHEIPTDVKEKRRVGYGIHDAFSCRPNLRQSDDGMFRKLKKCLDFPEDSRYNQVGGRKRPPKTGQGLTRPLLEQAPTA